VEKGAEGESLTREDQLLILMQAGLYLAATRGFAAPEARICYEHAESLSHSLNRLHLLYSALMGRWRHSLQTDRLTATMQIADYVYSLAQEQNDSALMIGAYNALSGTLYFLGDFEATLRYAIRGVQIRRSESYSLESRKLARPPSVFYAMKHKASGILERSPLLNPPWQKRSH
jgi:hypothetical protein